MAFLEKTLGSLVNAICRDPRTRRNDVAKTPPLRRRPSPTTSAPSESLLSSNSAPERAITPLTEEDDQIVNQPLESKALTPVPESQGPGENPGVLAGSHDFVLHRPIIAESQHLQLHFHGNPRSSRERLQTPTGEDPQVWPSQSSSGQGLSREVGNPTFIARNVHIHEKDEERREKRRKQTLKELKRRTIPGAEYNSAERDPPPRCHPGTRTTIREEFWTRIKSAKQGTRIIWMHGPAGVGKSAIMQTVVEDVSPRVVCATLFFSRPNRRDDARKAFTSLAYSFAVAKPEYCDYLSTRIDADPKCLTKSLDDQFKTLFVTPFVENHVKADSQPWVIFVDGLDECRNSKESDYQCRIMNIISDSVVRHAERTPFVWVIASRPEENLKKTWSQIRHRFWKRASDLWELSIPADSDDATRDVELFLHQQFEVIRENYSELIPRQSRWPSDSDFVKIAKKSSGLFVFASTVAKYVSDEDPVYRLKFVISLIDQAGRHPTTADESPFYMVDLLYSSIMSDIPKRLLPIAKSLLGFYHLLSEIIYEGAQQTMGLVDACNILGIQQSEAYAALRKLQSVLVCPTPKNAQRDGIRFFHASFPDFFLNIARSDIYHVDLDQELTNVWRRYTKIIKGSVTGQGRAGINISWLPDDNASLLDRLQKRSLLKAQNGWIKILVTYSYSSTTRRLQADVHELIEAFQNLGLAFLAGDRFSVQEFLDWLHRRAPDAIRKQIVSQKLTLGQLDKELLFRNFCAVPRYRWAQGHYVVPVDLMDPITEYRKKSSLTGPGELQWDRATTTLSAGSAHFRKLVEDFEADDAPVTVVGLESSESCAIVGPFFGIFYTLPYSAT